MAINCFRYLGFTSFEQIDKLTLSQYKVMMEALELRMFDQNYREHRQAYLDFAVRAEKSAGKGKSKPVYKKFRQFFDYERELERVKRRKEKQESRFAGLRQFLSKER